MNISNIQKSISEPRFARYLQSSNGSIEHSLELYIFNCRLCEAIYTPVNILEITLRNNFQRILSKIYGDDWYDNIFDKLLDKEQNKISEVKTRLIDTNKIVNGNNRVSTLSLAFWVSLLGGGYENDLWRPCFYYAFPNSPKPFTRRDIARKLSRIKDLRNRIAHHEPIYNLDLEIIYKAILEIIGWMCIDTKMWVQKNSRFYEVYATNIQLEEVKQLVNV